MDQLYVHGHPIRTLQDLIDRTLELDSCYQEKLRGRFDSHSHPSTRPDTSRSTSTVTPSSSGHRSKPQRPRPSNHERSHYERPPSSRPAFTTDSLIISKLDKDGNLKLDKHSQREKHGLCMYCGGKHTLKACLKRLAKEAAKPKN
jgi:hypothetical protein